MEQLLSICLGIGLSAACGFRVFVPLLVMSVAGLAGHLELSPGWEWIASPPALWCFLTATILEIGAYYVPWIDNLLDSIAVPSAAVAGTVVVASVTTEMSPLLRWSLAIIAGGGTAGFISMSTAALRGTSTLTTGGLTNWIVASLEFVASLFLSFLALIVPIVCVALVAFTIVVLVGRLVMRRDPPLVYEKSSKS